MPYLSPFDLAGIEPDTPASAEDWKRVKRKWLAEFELTDEPTLTVQGHAVNKQDILTLLEETENLQTMHFHRMVQKNPAFHQFLKGNMLEPGWEIPPRWTANHGFKQWVSAWVAERTAEEVKAYTNDPTRGKGLLNVFSLSPLISPADYSTAYGNFTDLLTETLSIQYNDAWKYRAKLIPQLQILAQITAKLPDHYSLFKRQIVHFVLNLTLFLAALGKFKLAKQSYHILDFLPTHLVPEEMRGKALRIIQSRNKREAGNHSPAGKEMKEHRDRVWGRIGWLAMLLLIIISIIRAINLTPLHSASSRLEYQHHFKGGLNEAEIEAFITLSNEIWWNPDCDTLPHDTIRPSTGYQPYLWRLPDLTEKDTLTGKFNIYNRTPFDGIFFLQSTAMEFRTIYHAYIRSGESWETPPLKPGKYQIRWYSGKNWWQDHTNNKYSRFIHPEILPHYQETSKHDRNWPNLYSGPSPNSVPFVVGLDMLQETYQESLH